MLRLKRSVLDTIIAHARNELPHEACGYLAGKNGLVDTSIALTNTDQAADHFSMDPAEQFAAVKALRAQDRRPCGVYHSHPETPARPSDEDIRLAHDPNVSYVIISFADPAAIEVRSFRIRHGQVSVEQMQLVEE